MELKAIELVGFKSFADRTTFTFDPGITAIVGPNGCGKSNVVDAVKWVLGEQSVKSLRGEEMADVIFKGSQGRKPLGYAEATLNFVNNRGLLPVEFEEVSVTRRVYRSGEGEYFINKSPVRLKDIRRLFMDTGIGMDSYSIMEQGKVDILIQAGPIERRAIFEEAAGISKYKSQKKETLAKLERVDQNCLRLKDIISEVESQLRSVKYQAAKARRFQEYTEEIKGLRVRLSLARYHDIRNAQEHLGQEITEKESLIQALRLGQERLEADESKSEASLREIQALLDHARSQLALQESQESLAKERISSSEALVAELAHRNLSLHEETSRLAREAAQDNEVLSRVEGELEEGRRLGAEKSRLLEEEQKTLAIYEAEVQAMAASLEESKRALIELLHKRSTFHNELGNVSANRRTSSRKLQQILERTSVLKKEIAELAPAQERSSNEVAALESETYDMEKKIGSLALSARNLGHEVETLKTTLVESRHKEGQLRSQVQILLDMEKRLEGLSSGVREILEEKCRSGAYDEILGMVADFLDVDPSAALAIEAALAEASEALIVSSTETLRALLKSLEAKPVRASFLALDQIQSAASAIPEREVIPEGAVPASSFVRASDPKAQALLGLLADVAVAPSLESALDFAFKRRPVSPSPDSESAQAKSPIRMLVTLRGERVEIGGSAPLVTTVGDSAPSQAGLISRRSLRRKLEGDLTTLEAELTRLQGEVDESKSQLLRIQDEKEQLLKSRESNLGTLHRKERELDRISHDLEQRNEEASVLAIECGQEESEVEGLRAKEQSLQEEEVGLSSQAATLEAQARELTSRQPESSRRRALLSEQITQLRVEVAKIDEQNRALKERMENFLALRRKREAREKAILNERDEIVAKESSCGEEIARNRALLERLAGEIDRLRLSISEKQGEQELLMTDLENKRQERKLAAEELDRTAAEAQNLRLKENEEKLLMTTLVERIQEEYHLDLAEEYLSFSREVPARPGEVVDLQAEEEKIAELKGKIERLGNVNLDAIAEQDSLESRSQFLNDQHQDLLRAKNSLEEAIHKINRTCKELFEDAFEKIRVNFREIFRKLFGGGKADIILINPQDILESGIEIIARPPGKESQVLSLLSGGEKVLTAVALIFAIFRTRPTPFCVLDEVDAALDETNIGRFIVLVREFLKDSQFMLVTHSKRTMSASDRIYGVTMPQGGVSKKVAVNFSDVSDKEGESFFQAVARLAEEEAEKEEDAISASRDGEEGLILASEESSGEVRVALDGGFTQTAPIPQEG